MTVSDVTTVRTCVQDDRAMVDVEDLRECLSGMYYRRRMWMAEAAGTEAEKHLGGISIGLGLVINELMCLEKFAKERAEDKSS